MGWLRGEKENRAPCEEKRKCQGKTKKYESFYARKSIIENVLYTNNHMQNSVFISLLQDYDDVLLTMFFVVKKKNCWGKNKEV